MESIKENTILETLQKIFYSICEESLSENNNNNFKKERLVTKFNLLVYFFKNGIIDMNGFTVIKMNLYINQLSPNEDTLNLKKFLMLIFFIYKIQTQKEEEPEQEITELSVESINELSENKNVLNETNNLIKVMIANFSSENKGKLSPIFNDKLIKEILSVKVLDYLTLYNTSLYNIISKYGIEDSVNKSIFYDLHSFNQFFIENNISSIFKGKELLSILNLININNTILNNEDIISDIDYIFERKYDKEELIEIFTKNELDYNSLNFSYSLILISFIIISLNLEANKDNELIEKIRFFLQDILMLKLDEVKLNVPLIDEKIEDKSLEDYLPESETLNKAKSKPGYTKEDIDFVNEFLTAMDKNLPPPEENVLKFANDYQFDINKLYIDKTENIPPQFPVERLQVEVDEEKEKNIQEREKRLIDRAKKPKKNQKEKTVNPYEAIMDEVPDEDKYNLKYIGKENIETMTYRLIKQTYKEILPNSRVYPSLIKEVLMIPNNAPQKCSDLIIESMEDQVVGRYEIAIRKLERAFENMPKDNSQIDWQCELFFNLSFASLYESLDFDIVAMNYLSNSVRIADKLILIDPDNALPYCFLGELFVKTQEYEWALRAYQKAKKIREETLGGDTLDTASIYNNLGVVAYCLESFLPAHGYFNLAYEIYKNYLGVTHPRTMMIKSNLTKMNQLNFNKVIQFKTLGIYSTSKQFASGKKKREKRKKRNKINYLNFLINYLIIFSFI